MRRPIVAGNWKMHGTLASSAELIQNLFAAGSAVFTNDNVDLVVIPPFVHLPQVRVYMDHLSGDGLFGEHGIDVEYDKDIDAGIHASGHSESALGEVSSGDKENSKMPISMGAQSLCEQVGEGAFTGEISGAMLSDVGCDYVLVGHSERRHIYKVSHEMAAQKCKAALEAGLTPILCVGETLDEREADQTERVVMEQIQPVIDLVGMDEMAKMVIAYEPVWAIGTGKTASPEQAQSVHAFIRGELAKQSASVAEGLRLLYGGSVKPGNAKEIFAMPDIDGGLIGGAALDADSFLAIAAAV